MSDDPTAFVAVIENNDGDSFQLTFPAKDYADAFVAAAQKAYDAGAHCEVWEEC